MNSINKENKMYFEELENLVDNNYKKVIRYIEIYSKGE